MIDPPTIEPRPTDVMPASATPGQALPTGTATFLFTDIEGSTRLLQALGDRFPALLEAHHRLVRAAVEAHGGRIPRTEGDSFFVVFPSAIAALSAAADAQRSLATYAWPADAPLRVRMGLHTGEAVLGGDDYVGLDVHRAARIAQAGHGGQVLLSEATRSLVLAALPAGTGLRDLGEHRLKDLLRPERLYQLDLEGLPTTFPPLRTLDRLSSHLPEQLTSFVGREAEVAEAARLLGTTRLLTLTGPGGTGKTRLSLQLAAEVATDFPDGVHFVPLAPITEPEVVPSEILLALDQRDTAARDPRERLLEYLRERRLLLVLDNFEQVLAAAPLVADFLRAAPGLKVVATSRAPLRVSGERQYPVPPLRLPDSRTLAADVSTLVQYEAVRLFVERAMAVQPTFQLTPEIAPAVVEICARLDGLPLAIELAAARVRVLTTRALLDRMEHRLPLLAGGSRDLPARQQTLRGAIAWSYDLLDNSERRLLARFSVFAGGATLPLAEQVCGPAEELDGTEVLDGLTALLDHSLVRQREQDDAPRFWLLETIREFAAEQLAASGEGEALAERHARAYLDLAEEAAARLMTSEQKTWLDTLDHEHDNLRAALTWCVFAEETELGLRLGAALWRFWQMRGYLAEGRQRLAHVLALPNVASYPIALMKAQEAAGGLAYWQGDLAMQDHYQQALDLARSLGDPTELANALYNMAFPFMEPQPDGSPSRTFSRAIELLQEAERLCRDITDPSITGRVLWGLATVHFWMQEFAPTRRYAEAALAVFRTGTNVFDNAWALHMIAIAALKLGDLEVATQRAVESLTLFARAQDVSGIALGLLDMAEAAYAAGHQERAIRLTAALSTLAAAGGLGLVDVNVAAGVVSLSEHLEVWRTTVAWREGAAMTLDEAVAYALKDTTTAAHSNP